MLLILVQDQDTSVFSMARLVPKGKVYAVDISPQMIGIVRSKMAKEKVYKMLNRYKVPLRRPN